MKKLFKLFALLKLVRSLLGRSRRDGGGHHRSRSHYPLYQRGGPPHSIADQLMGRLLRGRR